MVTCSDCGETVGAEPNYCPSCGAELPEETGAETAGGHSRGQHGDDDSTQSDSDRGARPDENERQQRSRKETGSARSQPAGRGHESTNGNAASSGPANRNSTGPPDKEVPSRSGQSGRSGHQAETQQPNRSRQSSPSAGGSLLGTAGQNTTEPDVNDRLWKIGWNPARTILGIGFVFLILAVVLELDTNGIGAMTIVGLIIGVGVWYLGVKEVNEHYEAFRDAFFERSANRAESRLGIDRSEVIGAFNFRSHRGGSPFLVDPSNYYLADHMVLSDVSVSVDQNSKYDMEHRGTDSDGTTKNIYYDNIESITTNDEGALTHLRIVTSRGENLTVNTVDQRVAEDAQGRLRSKMRDVRRARR